MSEIPEHLLAILGVLLFFGLLLPRLLRPLHLPFATSLILVGSVLGPHGIGLVQPDDSLALLGFLGGTFYMLLAGTDARALGVSPRERALTRLAMVNSLVPAAAGVAIGRWFGTVGPPPCFSASSSCPRRSCWSSGSWTRRV
jgi:Kef-type K+ transport system membrane component KefB